MFKKWFKKNQNDTKPKAPEMLGLYLGGAFEFDALRLQLIEPKMIFEGAAKTQLIQAVGCIKLDSSSTILRYYTDDDGYLQILLNGGMSESHIEDVKFWYYYKTQSVGSDNDWNKLLKHTISQSTYTLEGYTFQRAWESVNEYFPPVAMTEKTTTQAGDESTTDQFVMFYERHIDDTLVEFLMTVGEEKVIDNRLDRCFVLSTGFNVRSSDIQVIG